MRDNLEAGVQIGDFRIERRLGAGGMGIVYLARQVSLDRLVALKILGSALNRDADITRFRREAQAVAKLHHPGIATLHFAGSDGQVCYLAMQYIAGVSLRTLIDRLAAIRQAGETLESVLKNIPTGEAQTQALRFDDSTDPCTPQSMAHGQESELGSPTPEATRLQERPDYIRRCCVFVRDAALALEHAHERGVVHRDIKPGNILLDSQGQTHLIDFGLARFFEDATVTRTGSLIGTPRYMSPEQVTGRLKVDHRTDIYSLGLVLYELLSLRTSVAGSALEDILRQITVKALVPVSWYSRGVPRALEGIVHRATAKDPDERYQTAKEFAEDLQRFLAGRPVEARPYRYKFDEREIIAERPRGVTFTAFLLFFLGIFMSWATTYTTYLFYWQIVLSDNRGSSRSQLLLRNISLFTFYLAATLGCFWVASGLLSGRRRARWIGLMAVLAVITMYLSFTFSIFGVFSGKPVDAVAVSIPFLVITILNAPLLLSRRARNWFRLGDRLRAEFRQQVMPR